MELNFGANHVCKYFLSLRFCEGSADERDVHFFFHGFNFRTKVRRFSIFFIFMFLIICIIIFYELHA